MRTAVIYARISQDTTGDGLGVARQEADCRALVTARGWTLHTVLVDNDRSAYKRTRRPGYEALLELVRTGEADTVVAWHPDRLHRSPRELEDFVDLLEQTGATVATVTAGDVDLATPEGRLMARITGAVARKESEDRSRRARRKHLELAERGLPAGGGRRFGWATNATHDPTEAALIQEAARRVLAGESLWGITADWTARNIPTARGGTWSTTALKGILTHPRTAGLRQHRGQIVGDATWPPILDRDTWERVRAVLQQRSRTPTRRPGRYLLSGAIRCGSCGARMTAAPRPYGRAYGCLPSRHGGCGGTSIKAEPVEQLVEAQLLAAVDGGILDRARTAPARDRDHDLGRLLAVEEAKLEDYAAMLDAGDITRPEWAAMRAGATARIDQLRAELAAATRPNALEGLTAATFSADWAAMPDDRRRATLDALVERITVAPHRAGGRFDPSRVSIDWRA